MPRLRTAFFVFALAIVLGASNFVFNPVVLGQVSVSTGGLTGTVTDSQNAAVTGAKVRVSNADTGINLTTTTDSVGYFTVGALAPGKYSLRIESPNFKTFQTTAVVQVGQITTLNPKLEVGSSSTIIEVTGSAISINSEQASVQDVLTAAEIDQRSEERRVGKQWRA